MPLSPNIPRPASRSTGRRTAIVGARASPGPKFPAWADADDVSKIIASARVRMSGLPNLLPVFVPPWNAVNPILAGVLDAAALHCSAGGSGRGHAAVDILRWRDEPRFRGVASCLRRLTRELQIQRLAGAWGCPVGILTHHLEHDERAWEFLSHLLRWSHGKVIWLSPAEVFAGAARNH